MTPFDEGKLLRREVAKLRPDKRRRYPEELRRRILNWVDRATDAGVQEHECSKTLGVKTWRFTIWRRREARAQAQEDAAVQQAAAQQEAAAEEEPVASIEAGPLALVPIEVSDFPATPSPTIVTPSGYRIEGLSLEQVVVLLRELA